MRAMTRLAALVAAALAGSSAAGSARTKIEPLVKNFQAKPAGCGVTAYFASIGMGIDNVTRGRIERLLERDRSVVSVRPYLRGREGETLLCIRVARTSQVAPLFRSLRALVPRGLRGYPITIEAKGGLRFSRY